MKRVCLFHLKGFHNGYSRPELRFSVEHNVPYTEYHKSIIVLMFEHLVGVTNSGTESMSNVLSMYYYSHNR